MRTIVILLREDDQGRITLTGFSPVKSDVPMPMTKKRSAEFLRATKALERKWRREDKR